MTVIGESLENEVDLFGILYRFGAPHSPLLAVERSILFVFGLSCERGGTPPKGQASRNKVLDFLKSHG